ncbi:MAG: enoyl-CoA hydratase [Deltaproteobacteria bacterium]|nr:enoyl-CoA hydratase [Deltaproteobacteria bacterium]MBW2395106.1 enoyl-CoA hydratase [Deltaproteobacteria bacterium]
MTEPVLLVEKKDGLATVTLNRPDARNALSSALRRAIAAAFSELPEDPEVGAIVLTGAGTAFSAGVDLKELGSQGPDGGGGGDLPVVEDAIRAMEACPLPIVGAINGFAITGGFELALACDVLIGCPETRFADTHARVGLLPGWGLSQKLPRLIGINRAKLVSLTGNFVDAETAERWGLLAQLVPSAELRPTCEAIARDMLSCVPEAMRGYKKLIDEGFGMNYVEARTYERRESAEHIKNVSADDVAARRAGIQERGRGQSR